MFTASELADIIVLGIACILFLSASYTAWISYKEHEKTATIRAAWAGILLPIPFLILYNSSFIYKEDLIWSILFLLAALFIFFFLPIPKAKILDTDVPKGKIDERDVMFSRDELEPGTQRFNDYYKAHPEFLEVDNQWRKKAGLCQEGSSVYNPFQFSSAIASFVAVSHFHNAVNTKTTVPKKQVNASDISQYIKLWTKKLGALEVGICEMKDYHYYSHKGRGEDYGKVITQRQKYGIVLTVEMDKAMMSYAPAGPTVMESAQQYMNAGTIAMQVTEFIRQLGHDARAHIDGNYQVICPLVARDAGMGEIGRMGLLMTPKLGPRVRLAIITTDLPLEIDERNYDPSMTDFCIKCKKCAEVCPSNAISITDQILINGNKRWQINQEKCFDLWCQIGTDCGRCVSSCPYSHPDNFLHNVVRYGIKNSSTFRSFAAKMDDLLYGKIPPSKEVPEWMSIQEQKEEL